MFITEQIHGKFMTAFFKKFKTPYLWPISPFALLCGCVCVCVCRGDIFPKNLAQQLDKVF